MKRTTSELGDHAIAEAIAAAVAPMVAERLIEELRPQLEAAIAAKGDRPPAAEASDRWLSRREACAASGLGLTKIAELIAEGTLQTAKIGSRRLIRESSLRALMLASLKS